MCLCIHDYMSVNYLIVSVVLAQGIAFKCVRLKL